MFSNVVSSSSFSDFFHTTIIFINHSSGKYYDICYQNAGIPDKQHVVLVIALQPCCHPKATRAFYEPEQDMHVLRVHLINANHLQVQCVHRQKEKQQKTVDEYEIDIQDSGVMIST